MLLFSPWLENAEIVLFLTVSGVLFLFVFISYFASSMAAHVRENTTYLATLTTVCNYVHFLLAGTFGLFDDSFRRQLISPPALTPQLAFVSGSGIVESRDLQQQLSGSGCLCPIALSPDEPDAPTENEFLAGYNSAVKRLNEEGTLQSVGGVSDIESCE